MNDLQVGRSSTPGKNNHFAFSIFSPALIFPKRWFQPHQKQHHKACKICTHNDCFGKKGQKEGLSGKNIQASPYLFTVSVSTSGSKGVQLVHIDWTLDAQTCFSIHKRIEGGATIEQWESPPTQVVFQYPQADRRGCNPPASRLLRRVGGFQYPQADRRGCNSSVQYLVTNDKVFQYPQADRRGCNY